MENIQLENLEKQLKAFREQMREISEKERREELKSAHLRDKDFSADDLTEEDMRMWNLVNSRNFTIKEVEDYRKSIVEGGKVLGKLLPGVPKSRALFMGLIGNIAAAIIAEQDLERLEREEGE